MYREDEPHFARSMARAAERDRQPIVHRGAGIDANVCKTIAHMTSTVAMHHMIRLGSGQLRFGALNAQKEEGE